MKKNFYWKGPKEDIFKHIRECIACQQNKVGHDFPIGLLQPFPIPNQEREVSMDFIIGLSKVHGKDSIYFLWKH